MTPKISLVTVVAVALVAVPAAWGGQAQSNPRGMLASDAVESVREQAAQSFNTRNAMASDSVDAALASERSRRATASSYASSGIGAVPHPGARFDSGLGPRYRVAADRDRIRARHRARTRSLPGHALHADAPAGALIGSSHPQVPRPPSMGGRGASWMLAVYFVAWSERRSRTGGATGVVLSTPSSARSHGSV